MHAELDGWRSAAKARLEAAVICPGAGLGARGLDLAAGLGATGLVAAAERSTAELAAALEDACAGKELHGVRVTLADETALLGKVLARARS